MPQDTRRFILRSYLDFGWQCPLAMPTDPKWDAESIRIEDMRGRLNKYRLTVTGLPPGRYRLTADEEEFATASVEQLARGLDLLDYTRFPAHRTAVGLLLLVRNRQRRLYAAWRRTVGKWSPSDDSLNQPSIEDLKRQASELGKEIDLFRQPLPMRIRIAPVVSTSRPM